MKRAGDSLERTVLKEFWGRNNFWFFFCFKAFSLLFSLNHIFILCVKLVFVALQSGFECFQRLDLEVVVVC